MRWNYTEIKNNDDHNHDIERANLIELSNLDTGLNNNSNSIQSNNCYCRTELTKYFLKQLMINIIVFTGAQLFCIYIFLMVDVYNSKTTHCDNLLVQCDYHEINAFINSTYITNHSMNSKMYYDLYVNLSFDNTSCTTAFVKDGDSTVYNLSQQIIHTHTNAYYNNQDCLINYYQYNPKYTLIETLYVINLTSICGLIIYAHIYPFVVNDIFKNILKLLMIVFVWTFIITCYVMTSTVIFGINDT